MSINLVKVQIPDNVCSPVLVKEHSGRNSVNSPDNLPLFLIDFREFHCSVLVKDDISSFTIDGQNGSRFHIFYFLNDPVKVQLV